LPLTFTAQTDGPLQGEILDGPVMPGSGLWAWFPKAATAENRLGGDRPTAYGLYCEFTQSARSRHSGAGLIRGIQSRN